jgi:O-antigen/teichoic acid export membrane protein
MLHDRKMGRDVLWNLGALGVVASAGIVLNVLIARLYDPAVLGAFNQVLTFFIILSQVGALGIHFSVLRHIAEQPETLPRTRAVISSALVVVLCIASLTAIALALASGFIGRLLDSESVAAGLLASAPAVWLFALNKVLLNAFNALRAMRAFACYQALRPTCWVLFAGVFAATSIPGHALPWILTLTEGVMLLGLLGPLVWWGLIGGFGRSLAWVRTHLRFGWAAFVGGGLAEANSRVDIVVLGIFASDRTVGIYSAASMLVEGLVQLAAVLRNNLNPVIARLVHEGQRNELRTLISRGARLSLAALAAACVITLLAFPPIVRLALGSEEYLAAWPALGIMCAGLVLSSAMLPFDMFFIQVGLPALQTWIRLAVIVVNIAAAIALVPWLGMLGAGAAVAVMLVAYATISLLAIRRWEHAWRPRAAPLSSASV